MPIEFPCTNCAKQVRVPDGSEGKRCKCPECQTILSVPELVVETFDIKLEVPCPRCEFILVCDPALEGTRGLCPNCRLIFTITPLGTAEDVQPEANIQLTFAFQCPHCKQLFEGKPGMEGRNGKCIHCNEVFEIKKFVEPKAEPSRSLAAAVPRPVAAMPTIAKPVSPVAAITASSLNPYAVSASPNNLGATQNYGGQQGGAMSGTPESIRRSYLSHESAIKGFGLLYGIASVFYILFASAAVVLSVFAFRAEGGVAAGVFVLIYAAVYFTFGGLTALVCSGLYKLSDVGKIGGIIFAVLGLCAIPFGTILGGYLLFLLLSEKGNFVFSNNYRSIVKQTPHIRCTIPVFIWIILGLGVLLFLVVAVFFVGGLIRR